MAKVRLKTETFIERAKEIYGDKYNYSHVEYKGVDNTVNIICPNHGLFQKVSKNFLNGSGCNQCAIEETKAKKCQEFIEKSCLVHNYKYDYSKVVYINTDTKVEIICPIHGSFLQDPHGHLAGHRCPQCGNEIKKTKISDTLKSHKYKDYEALVNKIKDRHPNIIVHNIDTENDIIEAECVYHLDIEIKTRLRNGLKSRNEICPKCTHLNSFKDKNLVETFKRLYDNKYDYSLCQDIIDKKTVHIFTYIDIICNKHGPFKKRLDEHINGSGCPLCSKRGGHSQSAINWLEFIMKRDSIFIAHYRNNPDKEHIISGSQMKADGYCQETNTIYEFDGCYYHGCFKCFHDRERLNNICNLSFNKLYLNTLTKRKHILEQGYNLVFIWEHEWTTLNRMARKIQRFYRKYSKSNKLLNNIQPSFPI